jgi:hypothetical protein
METNPAKKMQDVATPSTKTQGMINKAVSSDSFNILVDNVDNIRKVHGDALKNLIGKMKVLENIVKTQESVIAELKKENTLTSNLSASLRQDLAELQSKFEQLKQTTPLESKMQQRLEDDLQKEREEIQREMEEEMRAMKQQEEISIDRNLIKSFDKQSLFEDLGIKVEDDENTPVENTNVESTQNESDEKTESTTSSFEIIDESSRQSSENSAVETPAKKTKKKAKKSSTKRKELSEDYSDDA